MIKTANCGISRYLDYVVTVYMSYKAVDVRKNNKKLYLFYHSIIRGYMICDSYMTENSY